MPHRNRSKFGGLEIDDIIFVVTLLEPDYRTARNEFSPMSNNKYYISCKHVHICFFRPLRQRQRIRLKTRVRLMYRINIYIIVRNTIL